MPPLPLMFNNRETALSAMVIAAVLVASFFAISFVQEASAQNATGGNMTAGGASTNRTWRQHDRWQRNEQHCTKVE